MRGQSVTLEGHDSCYILYCVYTSSQLFQSFQWSFTLFHIIRICLFHIISALHTTTVSFLSKVIIILFCKLCLLYYWSIPFENLWSANFKIKTELCILSLLNYFNCMIVRRLRLKNWSFPLKWTNVAILWRPHIYSYRVNWTH